MKNLKEFFIKNRSKFIIVVSVALIILSLVDLYYDVSVIPNSNDECLWVTKKISKDSTGIFFDFVKVNGVSWDAGIRNGDRLLAINENHVPNIFVAQQTLNKVNSGEYAKYTVMRDGNIFTAKVYIKKLVRFDILAFGLQSFFWIVIGFIVLMAKPDGIVQKLFFGIGALAVLASSFVLIQNSLSMLKEFQLLPILVAYICLLSICFLPFLSLYFFWIFPRQFKFMEKKWIKSAIFIIPGLIFLAFFTMILLTFAFNVIHNTVFFGILGYLNLFIGACNIVAFISLIINYRRLKTKEEKKPIAIILAAFVLAILASSYTAYIAPVLADTMFNYPEYYAPIILVSIFPLAFGYAIFKYQLMDVSVVIRNAITYGTATISVLAVYFLIIYLLGQTISKAIGTEYQGVIAGAAFIIFALVFQSTKNKFQGFLTEKFYPEQFAYQKILLSFSSEVSTLIGLEHILDSMKDTFVEGLKLKTFGILLKDKSGKMQLARNVGLSVEKLTLNAPGLNLFIKEKSLVSQNISIEQQNFTNVFPENAELLIRENIYTIIPMIVKSNVIGLVLFGLKHSGSQFSGKDIELLSAAANQSAIAIENAQAV